MYSAPAVIRTPAMPAQATPMPSPEMHQHVAYPWAAHTPESSPMLLHKIPCIAEEGSAEPQPLNGGILKDASSPHFEQMCRSLGSATFIHQLAAQGGVSRELLRKMCEPYFEQMLISLQDTLQDQQREMAACPQSLFRPGQQVTPSSLHGCEEESTEAEGDAFAFASILSSTSSDADVLDAVERKSVTSEATGDSLDKSPMVCRHWKSKGWCRLGGDCKFLHPEHKRGISAPTEIEIPTASQTRRRKRGGKNRSTKAHPGQLGDDAQSMIRA